MKVSNALSEKPYCENGQAVSFCSSDSVEPKIERDSFLGFSKHDVNPRPELHFDKTGQIPNRFFLCSNYDMCLDIAIAHGWDSFTCEECKNHKFSEFCPDEWLADTIRCRQLIEALEQVDGEIN